MSHELHEVDSSDARLGALVRGLSQNLYIIWLVLAAMTMVRNSLEMLGLLTGSPNYCCFSPDLSSFLNTFTYELLLIFGGMYIVHLVLGGNRQQLRRLIAVAVAFMIPLFIFVPLANLALNYQGPRIPIYLLPNTYLPMGSVLGFLAIIAVLLILIRRIYPERGWPRVLLGLGAGFLTMFFWTYVYGFRLSFSSSIWLWEREAHLMDVYSLSFVAPLVFTYPFFLRSYLPKGRRLFAFGSYVFVLGAAGWLVHTSHVVAAPTRLREPLVCEQVVLPRLLPGMNAAQVKSQADEMVRMIKEGKATFSMVQAAAAATPVLGLHPSRVVFRRVPGVGAGPLHQAAFALKPGQISGIIEAPLTLRLLQRIKTPADGEVQHIMVARQHARWKTVASAHVQRRLVRRRAESLRMAVMNHPHAFGEMARKASDGPFASQRGRVPMEIVKEFRTLYDAVLRLRPGEVSPIADSPWGLHIFRRLP